MSLGIVVNGPEGLVLAAESRVTLTVTPPNAPPFHVNFDNATKLFSFSPPNSAVGVVTYGQASIGLRTAHSFVPEFEAGLTSTDRLHIADFAQVLSDFYLKQWRAWEATLTQPYAGPDMIFMVAGFDEKEAYGKVFQFNIPSSPVPVDKLPNDAFGINWGGQREIVDRLLQGFDNELLGIVAKVLNLKPHAIDALHQALAPLQFPLAIQAMALQDCVDLAIFFIRTTINAQSLAVGLRGCGGPIDVATITRQEGLRFIQRKAVMGEAT